MLGGSIIHLAGERAKLRGTPNLGFPSKVNIHWFGIESMIWSDFVHSVEGHRASGDVPKLICIHHEGRDFTRTITSKMKREIEQGIQQVIKVLPNTSVLWIDILKRIHWTEEGDGQVDRCLEERRKRLNRAAHSCLRKVANGHFVMFAFDINKPELYTNDGFHLSDMGLDLFIDSLWSTIFDVVFG